MKKVFLSICFLCAAVTFVSAQQGQAGGADRQAQMKQRLKDQLALTDVQIDSVMAIQQAFSPQTREIMRDQSASAADKQAKMKTIVDQRNKRLESALPSDAAKKVEDYYAKQMERMMNGGGRPAGGGGNQ